MVYVGSVECCNPLPEMKQKYRNTMNGLVAYLAEALSSAWCGTKWLHYHLQVAPCNVKSLPGKASDQKARIAEHKDKDEPSQGAIRVLILYLPESQAESREFMRE